MMQLSIRHLNLKAIIIVLFTLSGISGLIYEIAWSKYLSTFIGSTAYSQMIVLATFMGGLAFGAYYWGKFVDRMKNQLKLYAMLEIAIGVYCFSYPWLLNVCENIFVSIALSSNIASNPSVLLLLKFLLSFVTLILPTFLMGGTLPVLTKFISRNIAETGKDVAVLYFINSFGAVLGAILGGFFLVRLFSLDNAVWIAASINSIVGIAALMMSKPIKGDFLPESVPAPPKQETVYKFPQRTVTIAIITAALTGFVAMLYELTWIRLLANILGSSTYSFSLMLIAFISGITLGSWIISLVIKKIKNLFVLLGICQFGTAIFMLMTLPLYERLSYFLWKFSNLFSNKPENFPYFLVGEFFFCFLIMIVPTTFSGMSLPIISRIASKDIKVLGKTVGGVFSINTIGTVFGALMTGLVLIPLFGIKQSMEIGVLINGLLGLVILITDVKVFTWMKVGLPVLLIALGTGYRLEYPKWSEMTSIGVFRLFYREAPSSYEDFKNRHSNTIILWSKEGVDANVTVAEEDRGGGLKEKLLFINGKADASSISDLSTQTLSAQIPLMMCPDSGNALVIGLGCGATTGSMLQHPIRSLDCVEISQEVVDASKCFTAENHNYLQDPRLKMHIEDGITYMKLTPTKYDYIVSEPSNPWIAGIGNLFTLDFFQLCKDRLNANGVLVQWFHTYENNDETFQLVLRTISRVFPYISIWSPMGADVILMASMSPVSTDFDAMEKKFSNPSIAQELRRIQVPDLPTFLSTQSYSSLNNTLIIGDGPINREKQPLLEFMAPVSLFANSSATIIEENDERFSAMHENLLLNVYEKHRGITLAQYLNIARYFSEWSHSNDKMAYSTLKKCLQLDPNNSDALIMLTEVTKRMNLQEERLAALRALAEQFPDDVSVLANYAWELYLWKIKSYSVLNTSDLSESVKLLMQCIDITDRQNEQFFIYLAMISNSIGRYNDAAEAYKYVLSLRQKYEPVMPDVTNEEINLMISENYLAANRFQEAQYYLERAQEINPALGAMPMRSRKILSPQKELQ